MEIDNFLIFKNKFKKEGSNQPDYKVTIRQGDKFISWGAGWIKDGKDGKYISCSKDKPRKRDVDFGTDDETNNPSNPNFDNW